MKKLSGLFLISTLLSNQGTVYAYEAPCSEPTYALFVMGSGILAYKMWENPTETLRICAIGFGGSCIIAAGAVVGWLYEARNRERFTPEKLFPHKKFEKKKLL